MGKGICALINIILKKNLIHYFLGVELKKSQVIIMAINKKRSPVLFKTGDLGSSINL